MKRKEKKMFIYRLLFECKFINVLLDHIIYLIKEKYEERKN